MGHYPAIKKTILLRHTWMDLEAFSDWKKKKNQNPDRKYHRHFLHGWYRWDSRKIKTNAQWQKSDEWLPWA